MIAGAGGEVATRAEAVLGAARPPGRIPVPGRARRADLLDAAFLGGTAAHGITLETLRNELHGIDFGPLAPSLFERLETADRKVDCAPDVVLADVARFMSESLASRAAAGSCRTHL